MIHHVSKKEIHLYKSLSQASEIQKETEDYERRSSGAAIASLISPSIVECSGSPLTLEIVESIRDAEGRVADEAEGGGLLAVEVLVDTMAAEGWEGPLVAPAHIARRAASA